MKTSNLKNRIITLVIIAICSFQLKAQNDSLYVLPIASDTTLGGVKIGEGLKIDENTGVLSLDSIPDITLPIASNSELGGIKVGEGLKIDETTGALSLDSIPDVTLSIASDNVLGGIKVGEGLKIDQSTGLLSLDNVPVTLSFGDIVSVGIKQVISSTMLGYQAGYNSHTTSSNMLGSYAGYESRSYDGNNNYIGNKAGYQAQGGYNNHIGYEAGYNASGNNTGTIFIGRYAGKKTTSSDGVVFLGGSAGENAQNTTHSVFIAPKAGYQSTNVSKGIYIGYEAGAYSNASYCILIGENAGRSVSSSNKIGNNNIILGNGTTLPGGTQNTLNIGNLLYGTGIQETTNGYPVSTPKTAGRIGIATYNPQATLHVNGKMLVNDDVEIGTTGSTWIRITKSNKNMRVNGTITATEINVKTNVWADHVFEDSYRLAPLEEVDMFVKENKHLSGVPSAGEVFENGIDVAQMNVILLKKVEELTLYVIELNKEIQDLKSGK